MFVQRHSACFLSDVLIFWSNETLPVLVGVDMFDTDFLAVIFIGVFFFFACYGLWVVFACLFSCWQTAVVVRLPHWAQTKAKHAAVIIGRERELKILSQAATLLWALIAYQFLHGETSWVHFTSPCAGTRDQEPVRRNSGFIFQAVTLWPALPSLDRLHLFLWRYCIIS